MNTNKFKSLMWVVAVFACAEAQTYYWNPVNQPSGADAQRAFNWTSNKDGSGDAPASKQDDDFNAPTLNPVWKFIDWTAGVPNPNAGGNKNVPGSYSLTDPAGALKITGRGGDLAWGWREIAAVYRTDIKGDFDVSVKINSHSGSNGGLKTGIVIYNDFNAPASGGGFAVMATRDYGFIVDYDLKAWGPGDFNYYAKTEPRIYTEGAPEYQVGTPANPYWLRAVKNGVTFSGYYKKSLTGPWILIHTGIPKGTTAANSQIGLFITASDPVNNATVIFDNFSGGGNILSDSLDLNFSGKTSSQSIAANLTAPLKAKSIDLTGYTGKFSFLKDTLSVFGNVNLGTGTSLVTGNGALALLGTDSQTVTALDTLPKLVLSGSGTLKLGGDLLAKSFTHTAGKIDFNAKNMTVLGNWSTTNGTPTTFIGLGGRTLRVDSAASFSGTFGNLLNLHDISDWSINAGITLEAKYATIGRSRATGAVGAADSTSANAGNNVDWQFSDQLLLFTSQSPDTTIFEGDTVTLSVSATGPGQIDYNWRKKGSGLVLSQTSELVFEKAQQDVSGEYQCTATNANGSRTSRYIKLAVVGDSAKISVEPVDASVKVGQPAKFTVAATGGAPLTYKWMRVNDTATLSTDTVLNILKTTVLDKNARFWVIVSNASNKDTSRQALLAVNTCDSLFEVTPESLLVDEGQPFVISGRARCADQDQWSLVSGPAPKILNPEADTLRYNTPRVSKDTNLVYQFSATYGSNTVTKRAVVRVRNAIPDPKFSLTSASAWTGTSKFTMRPTILNLAELATAKYTPPMRYNWIMTDSIIEFQKGGDSLVLLRVLKTGITFIQLCVDNGGAVACEITKADVKLAPPVNLALGLNGANAPFQFSGKQIIWTSSARIQIWSLQGQLLWDNKGKPGQSAVLSDNAYQALNRNRAILDLKLKK